MWKNLKITKLKEVWKKKDEKLYDSIYIKFWKRQNTFSCQEADYCLTEEARGSGWGCNYKRE
jgi:hypothetical protein